MRPVSASRLSTDVTVTLLARVLPGLLSLVAVPVYVRLLGARGYAVIGLFLTLQSIIGLLDFGMSATVTREVAWEVGRGGSQTQLDIILRTFRAPLLWLSAAITMLAVVAGRVLLSSVFGDRIEAAGLDAFDALLLVLAIGLRFPLSVYTGFLAGVGRLSAGGTIVMTGDVSRVASTLVAVYWTRSLTAFFVVHCLTSVAMLWSAARSCRRELGPVGPRRNRPDWSLLAAARPLIIGSGMLSLLFVGANSIDKLVLPRFATVEEFGAYVALGQLAVVPFMVVHAIWTAGHPRLLSVLAGADAAAAAGIFGMMAGAMASLACAAIVFVVGSANWLALHWLGERARMPTGAAILALLTLGYVAAGLSHLALSIQQARKTMASAACSLIAYLCVAGAVLLLVPAVRNPVGCAALWCSVYSGYMLAGAMAFRGPDGRLGRIWLYRLLTPLLLSIAGGFAVQATMERLPELLQPMAAALAALVALVLVAATNQQLRSASHTMLKRLIPRRQQ